MKPARARQPRQKTTSSNKVGIRTEAGVVVKSKFEKRIADSLSKRNVKYVYEKGLKLNYVVPESKHTYTPDFQLRGRTWYVEAKGVLDFSVRAKMLHVKASNPDADIRFVFQRDNPIYKGSKTRYSDWAAKHGFKYAIGDVPEEWIEE